MKDVGKVKCVCRDNSPLPKIKEIPERGVSSQTKLSMLCLYLFGNVFHECSKYKQKNTCFLPVVLRVTKI